MLHSLFYALAYTTKYDHNAKLFFFLEMFIFLFYNNFKAFIFCNDCCILQTQYSLLFSFMITFNICQKYPTLYVLKHIVTDFHALLNSWNITVDYFLQT